MMENIDIKYIDIEELGTWPIHQAKFLVREGALTLSQHLIRERNSKIVKIAKQHFKERHNGRVFCEVCAFDFSEKYGNMGDGFIEAHHKKPISRMDPEDTTTIDDFVMVCSNCHSMLHTGNEWISHEALKEIIKNNTTI